MGDITHWGIQGFLEQTWIGWQKPLVISFNGRRALVGHRDWISTVLDTILVWLVGKYSNLQQKMQDNNLHKDLARRGGRGGRGGRGRGRMR